MLEIVTLYPFEVYVFISTPTLLSPSSPWSSLQFLYDSPASDIPRLLTPDSDSELLCEVTVNPEPAVLEIHNPPPEALLAPPSGLEPDSRLILFSATSAHMFCVIGQYTLHFQRFIYLYDLIFISA